MKKIIILIPVFNDWESLKKLMIDIDQNLRDFKDFIFECVVINDASTSEHKDLFKPENIRSIKILNMKVNQGHARCNAFGIRYIVQKEKFDYVILMDGDGEDRPVEIKSLINKILEVPNNSVVAKRIKRSEGVLFKSLYEIHKFLTFFFTGEKINFGNYSCLIKNDVETISNIPSLWSSYSGTIKKNIKSLQEINSIRGVRYFGPSKMSIYKLLIHSFSIIAVFKYQVFLRSFLILLILEWFKNSLHFFALSFQISIIFFNLIIFLTSLREKEKDLINSHLNLKNIDEIAS